MIAAKFHNTLAELIVETAARVGEKRVVLSGGCFQNRYLSERVITRLETEGFHPYWHQRVPPNDGGIALGQIYAWLQAHRQEHREVEVEIAKIGASGLAPAAPDGSPVVEGLLCA
jgi:hydrogenase maturation factor HypF (carbamoyltransferase family)